MRSIVALLFAAGVLAAQSQPLAITHVTVIDVTGGPTLPDSTVLIEGARITALGPTTKVRVRGSALDVQPGLQIPAGARVIDGSGKYLIPGLWDMHVHAATDKSVFIPIFVANGITGIRSMYDPLAQINDRRREIAAGDYPGPRMFASGPIVDGPKPIWPGSLAAGNAEQGREAVAKLKQMGADFVKVYSLLPRDAYFGVADEAKKQHIPFAGHVPESVTAGEASDAGQKSIEHLTGLQLACSSIEPELRKEMNKSTGFADWLRVTGRGAETYDAAKCEPLFQKFKQNGTWQTPTLTVLRGLAFSDDKSITGDSRLRYVPAAIIQYWKSNPVFTPEEFAAQKRGFQNELKMVGAMNRDGVQILAGTDTPNPYVFPGFSLHDELQLLVKAGLTPMQALQASTRNAARYLGIEDTDGTIAANKTANLVLLDANPLEDIANTQKIRAVVIAGKLLDRTALDAMLAKVEKAAQPPRTNGVVAAPPGSESGVVSDFEQEKIHSRFGAGWDASTDSLMGGKSTAKLSLENGGANGTAHALRIDGEIIPGAQFTWAGAMFSPGAGPMASANLSSKKRITFWVKGENREYQILIFAQSFGFTPAAQSFRGTAEWTQISLPLNLFNGTDAKDLMGVFFGATEPPGKFTLRIDEVRFE